MKTELWNKINDFELDEQNAEYSFSVRLADENKWTIYFTEQAILEYKRFMYLAATAEEMVSPSEIVDIVWHQHLIFTKSYQSLGKILDKKIEHIPSTHNTSQKETFVRAKQRTTQLYEVNFGKQPIEFWTYVNMEDSFDIPKSNRNNFYSMLAASILFVILIYPAAYVLRPLLITIENPNFMIGYVLFMILTLILLTIYNKNVFNKVARNSFKSPILSNLTAEELIYLKTNSLGQVLHGIVNKLVVHHIIGISKDFKIKTKKQIQEGTLIEDVIYNYVEQKGESHYPLLVNHFIEKPIVTRYTHAHFHLNRLFNESKSFANMLLVNFSVFLLILLIGSSRMLVGISRDKPVLFLVIGLIAFLIAFVIFQKNRSIYFTKKAIPEQFKEEVISSMPDEQKYKETEWQYFLLGTAAFAFTFSPLASYAERNKNNNSSNSCGTSGGAGDGGGGGDGGSCGGGCGGCGGGGD